MAIIRVALVEESLEAREGLKYMLNMDRELKVVSAPRSLEKLLTQGSLLTTIDVVVVDLDHPEKGGIEAIRQLSMRAPHVKILILTIHENELTILDTIGAGALGYLNKKTDIDRLAESIKCLESGGSPITPVVARQLLNYIKNLGERKRIHLYELSPRELQIFHCIIQGMTYREIAEKHSIAVSTAKKHILQIYRKTGTNSKLTLIRKFIYEPRKE